MRGARSRLGGLAGRLPYGLLARMVPGVACAQRAARTALFRRAVDEVRDACELTGLPVSPPDALDAALRRIVWERLRRPLLGALARAPRRRLTRWVAVEGVETLEHSRGVGRGVVVVNSHFGIARAVQLVLSGLGYPLYSLEAQDFLARVGVLPPVELEVAEIGRHRPFRLREVYRAHGALERGSLVHLLGDGRQGGSELALPFHGRLRAFRTGFAELAVMTGASVIPVFATLDRTGRTRLELLEALDDGAAGVPRGDRVASLVEQYARLLEARWVSQPGEVMGGQLSLQRGYPVISPRSVRPAIFESTRQRP
jgi:lauroyl/myristoyl acyltransferase